MKKEEQKVDFDLSVLSLSELITLYEKVATFSEFLAGLKIEEEEKGDKND